MKTAKLIAAAVFGIAGSAHAFTVDFSAFTVGLELNPDLVVNVPGYGPVRFSEAANNKPGGAPTALEVTDLHANSEPVIKNSIGFIDGEQMLVTFEGPQVFNVNYDFAGVNAGEQFTVNTLSGESGPFLISFSGALHPGGGLVAVSFESIPEPSSSLLVAMAGLGLITRRRR